MRREVSDIATLTATAPANWADSTGADTPASPPLQPLQKSLAAPQDPRRLHDKQPTYPAAAFTTLLPSTPPHPPIAAPPSQDHPSTTPASDHRLIPAALYPPVRQKFPLATCYRCLTAAQDPRIPTLPLHLRAVHSLSTVMWKTAR